MLWLVNIIVIIIVIGSMYIVVWLYITLSCFNTEKICKVQLILLIQCQNTQVASLFLLKFIFSFIFKDARLNKKSNFNKIGFHDMTDKNVNLILKKLIYNCQNKYIFAWLLCLWNIEGYRINEYIINLKISIKISFIKRKLALDYISETYISDDLQCYYSFEAPWKWLFLCIDIFWEEMI